MVLRARVPWACGFFFALLLGFHSEGRAQLRLIEAETVSQSQGGPQPVTSIASVRNGALVPGSNVAGPNGTSSAGPIGPNATYAFADTTQIDGPVITTSSAGANLGSGKLRADVDTSTLGNASVGTARARVEETVTFNNLSGSLIELDIFWNTQGVVTSLGSEDITTSIEVARSNTVNSTISLKGTPSQVVAGAQFRFVNGTGFFTFNPVGNNLAGVWTTTADGLGGGLIRATLEVPQGLSAIDLKLFIHIDCRAGSACAYNNTSEFQFGPLPTGLTFTSTSGAFLTGIFDDGFESGDLQAWSTTSR